MGDLRADMTKAIEDQIVKLAHIRGCSKAEAAKSVSLTFAENLKDSRGTSMEDYWVTSLDIADHLAASELSAREHSQ